MRPARSVLILLFVAWPAWASAATSPNGLVMLFTDYGADSIYAGVLKGAVYAKFPQAKVDSVTHSVPPYDIVAGAYMLAEACPVFPKGTTFCCVVDPGVGTARKCVALETKAGHVFVAPDNGLLARVADLFGVESLHECANQDLWGRTKLSVTFQGRDIFGPVAAAVAAGTPLDDLGPRLETLKPLDFPAPGVTGEEAYGAVVRVDHYGNMVTNITSAQIEQLNIQPGGGVQATIGAETFTAPFARTYADIPKGQRLILLQSSNFVECAINQGDLAGTIKQPPHARVSIKKAP